MMEPAEQANYILEHKKEAEDARLPRKLVWEELWGLFQNRQDYGKKEDWQARVFVPKLFMTVMQAASVVKRAVISTRKLFKLAPKYKDDKEAEAAKQENEEALKRALEESNFVDTYSETMIPAFLLGFGATKILWNGGLDYTNVDIFNLYIDPLYEPHQKRAGPKYVIEYIETDLAALRLAAREINRRARRRLYKMGELNKIEEDFRESERDVRLRGRRGLGDYSPVEKKVGQLQYWGDIIAKDNKSIKQNHLQILANDKYVIRDQPNPFEHGRAPYVFTVPLVYPHRGIAGISLVEPMVKMQYAYNSITNLAIDNMNFTVNKMFEVRPTNLLNPKNANVIYPGKMFKKHTDAEAIREVRTKGIGQEVFTMFDFLGREIEKGTGVTEFIMGAAGKSKTATEAELKTAQAQGLFDVIARDIEANSLTRLIEMSFDLMIQFGQIDSKWRGRYDFKVGGLSLLLARREQQAQIGETIMLTLKSPEIRQMTDLATLYKKHLDLNNLGEVFAETAQPPTNEQALDIQKRAAEDARNAVAQMSPEEIMNATE